MTEKRRAIGTDLRKLDEHVITPEEYEDIPELTDEDFARGILHINGVPVATVELKTDFTQIMLTVLGIVAIVAIGVIAGASRPFPPDAPLAAPEAPVVAIPRGLPNLSPEWQEAFAAACARTRPR